MKGDTLKVKINTPFFKLDLVSKPTPGIIREIKSLMKEISYQDVPKEVKEGLPFELDYNISEEFKNSSLNNFIRRAFTVSENFVYKKATLNLKGILDVRKNKVNANIDKTELEKCLNKLFFQMNTEKADFLAVHIIGELPKEALNLTIDQIQKRAGRSEIKAANTVKKMLGKIVIEILFFGDFPYEYDEPFFE